jgi:hypothetical protein
MLICTEKPNSPRVVDRESVERLFTVHSTTDEVAARWTLLATAPVIDSTGGASLLRQSVRIEKQGKCLDVWDGTVTYGKLNRPDLGTPTYRFSTKGGTTKITHSLATVGRYVPEGKMPFDHQGAINVKKSGDVDGVDVVIPKFGWTETHYLPVAEISDAYRFLLAGLTGTVNANFWRAFAPGEALFLGVDGGPRDQQGYELSFEFAAEPNVSDMVIGSIHGVAKRGWDYLWVEYEQVDSDSAKRVGAAPLQVNVEQVYYYRNFAFLGIG